MNRVALILTPKRRFVEWANSLPDPGRLLTLEEARSLRTVFLAAVDDPEPDLQDLIGDYWEDLFEEELAGWTSDESLWPPNLSAHVFRDWFQVDVVEHVTDADPEEPLTLSEQTLTRCAACGAPLEEVIHVALEEDGASRVTAEEADRLREELALALENGDPRPRTLVLRCCSDGCASSVQTTYATALASPEDPDRS